MKNFLCSVAVACAAFAAPEPAASDVLLTHISLVDVETGTLTLGQSVLITGDRVAGIGTTISEPEGTAVLDGSGAYLFAISPGHPAPLRDANGDVVPGSLSERMTVEIGGITQSMIIQSVDPANPVLLLLHGGSGMPEFFMDQDYPTGLERHFTMVWWEQRGAGMSFSADIPPETMTMDQMIADRIEVAGYLRDRFGQDRILLRGHSWGSYLGIQVAAQAPDRFLAYVGMTQIVHQLRSEVMAHDYLLGGLSGARRCSDGSQP